MQIAPSETNESFATGAVRGEALGKGKSSLLPFEALELVAAAFGGWAKLPWAATLAVSKVFEAGGRKYADRNWEHGIPCSRYVDSATRHYAKFLKEQTDEPHCGQYCWNLLCLLQTHLWVATLRRDAALGDLPEVDYGCFPRLLDIEGRQPVYVQGYPVGDVLAWRDVRDELASASYKRLAAYVLGQEAESKPLVYAAAYGLALLEHTNPEMP